jgi:hypothetical protein
MAAIITCQYQKPGSTFSDAVEANTNKNSMVTESLMQTVSDCNDAMLAAGIMTAPISYSWNPDTCILGIVKSVRDADEYYANITFDTTLYAEQTAQTGWTYVDDIVTPV